MNKVVPLKTARSEVPDEEVRRLQRNVDTYRRLAEKNLARARMSVFELAHEAREQYMSLALIHAEWADIAQARLANRGTRRGA